MFDIRRRQFISLIGGVAAGGARGAAGVAPRRRIDGDRRW
jgi:hypothetical protein